MTATHLSTPTHTTRILVVDDTPDNLFLMNGLLEDRYQVIQAASGKEALKVVMSAQPPDMVLLDIMMPDMDGYEVLRRIRQHTPTANIPVIFVTALASTQDELLGLDLGAVDYLTKPVNPDLVIQRVEAQVQATLRARRLEALSEKLARHLCPEAYDAVFSDGQQAEISFEQRVLTVLYADVGQLTALASAWQCPDGPRVLESFRREMGQLADQYGAVMDRYVSDGTLIFCEDPLHAVQLAQAMQQRTAQLQRTWRAMGAPAFQMRIGLHTGVYDLSTFSSGLHDDCTLIGPETGLAAKVAAAASNGSIALSPQTCALVQDEIDLGPFGSMSCEDWADSRPPEPPHLTASAASSPQHLFF